MRLFLGFALDDRLRSELSARQEEMRRFDADLRWIAPRELHLTLKFLGSIDAGRLGPLRSAVETVAARHNAFQISFQGLGVFPDERRPAVLWAGVQRGKEALKTLAADLEDAAAALGWEKEKRPYEGHVTLGRFKSAARWPALRDYVESHRLIELGSIRAGEIVLFESRLGKDGSHYEAVGRVPLR